MLDLVKNNQPLIEEICKRNFVKTLYLFGSAAKNNFDISKSDLDFVVEFKDELDPIDFAEFFFGLLDELKALFEREIDLLSYRALKNKILIAEIERSKIKLYAA